MVAAVCLACVRASQLRASLCCRGMETAVVVAAAAAAVAAAAAAAVRRKGRIRRRMGTTTIETHRSRSRTSESMLGPAVRLQLGGLQSASCREMREKAVHPHRLANGHEAQVLASCTLAPFAHEGPCCSWWASLRVRSSPLWWSDCGGVLSSSVAPPLLLCRHESRVGGAHV